MPRPRLGTTLRQRCPQPACAGKRSQSLAITGTDDGAVWHCHRCGWSGGGRDHGRTERRPIRTARPSPQPQRHETLSPWGRALWAACQPITADDLAGRYLTARGCALPPPGGDLKWHPSLPHPTGHVGPALVGLVTAATDATCWLSLHRTWIDAERPGRKAAIDPPRLLLKAHPKAGGCVRLWPDHGATFGLGLGEGLETSLVLARAFTPVWAAIDAGNLASLPYVYPVQSLTVAVDHDEAGIRAADALAARWTAAGAEVRRVMAPHDGDDLADWATGVDHAAAV